VHPRAARRRARLGAPLLTAVHGSQLTQDNDVGHMLTGLDAMRCPTPKVVLRILGVPVLTANMPSVEFATWGGDVGSAVAQQVHDVGQGVVRPWSFYFGLGGPAGPADMRGDVDAYAVRGKAGACSAATVGTAFPQGQRASTTLGAQYDDVPTAAAGVRCLLATIGATVSGTTITPARACRAAVHTASLEASLEMLDRLERQM
jgi:hypothetical protein